MKRPLKKMKRPLKKMKLEKVKAREVDLLSLTCRITEIFQKEGTRSEAYSSWAVNGYLEDYAEPGFAYCYTHRHFIRRSRATCDLRKVAQDELGFMPERVEILDIGAGPGCAAAGVIKSYYEQGIPIERVIFTDKVEKWKAGLKAYRSLIPGIDFFFDCRPETEHWEDTITEQIFTRA
ncbi:unnamed protein product [Durusdinium trenchii]|uniref:Uncharacterized protein n=1 Tax=Durusdinium trenchii TaxID=1381693 RepID=A0ABP0PSZ9_9DINO